MKCVKALGLLPAFIIVGLMRALYPWVKIRVGEIWAFRLGHLVGNTECYLCERDAGMHKMHIDFFYSRGPSAHPLIEKKYRAQLHTLPAWLGRLVVIVNRLFEHSGRFEIGPQQVDRDINNLWEKHGPHLSFTDAEEREGKRLLKSLGIPDGAKWACLIVRDSEYLKQNHRDGDYSYHDYRDSDISNYVATCRSLIHHGYYVIRMGKVAAKRLPIRNRWVIDYPFHRRESDFGQLYLGAKCAFCFGASTGFMAIPQVFLRPTAVVNFAPLEYISTWCRGIVIWKHHMKDGKRMTLKEIFESGAGQYLSAKQFQEANIRLVENNPQEIHDAVMELESGVSDEVQVDFWSRFPFTLYPVNQKPLHGRPRVRVGRKFLEGYQ